jgi:hypothetical protein
MNSIAATDDRKLLSPPFSDCGREFGAARHKPSKTSAFENDYYCAIILVCCER